MSEKPSFKRYTALYERLSKDDDLIGESNSVTNQMKYLEDFAKKNGFKNLRHFTDDGLMDVGNGDDMLEWLRKINNVRACADEIVLHDVVYD